MYQWGRGADGHQCRNSATTTTLSSTDQPGHGNFIVVAYNSPCDWRSPQNINLWQGVNGINNPCPSGYRLPSDNELDSERLSWLSNNSVGAYNSPLKWTIAGIRLQDGTLFNVGVSGIYWSSTISIIYSRDFRILSDNAMLNTNYHAFGYPIRCIKN